MVGLRIAFSKDVMKTEIKFHPILRRDTDREMISPTSGYEGRKKRVFSITDSVRFKGKKSKSIGVQIALLCRRKSLAVLRSLFQILRSKQRFSRRLYSLWNPTMHVQQRVANSRGGRL
jgi:hypothetical protein